MDTIKLNHAYLDARKYHRDDFTTCEVAFAHAGITLRYCVPRAWAVDIGDKVLADIVGTSHVGLVAEVHEDPKFEDTHYRLKWLLARINTDEYDHTQSEEAEFIDKAQRVQFRELLAP